MDRRSFLTTATAGGLGTIGAAGLATPALAQTPARIVWRCLSAFPASAGAIFAGATGLARAVREASDGAFDITVVPAGEEASGPEALDAVLRGEAEMCHTAAHYAAARNPVYALAAGVPFGPNARGMQAWLRHGEGPGLLDAFFAGEGLAHLPGGATGTQMGGWFKREIRRVEDLSGLKMRVAGLGGRVLAKLGVVPVDVGSGGILAALKAGTIDAAEWAGPEDDERLGLVEAAPYYAYPGWWEGGPSLSFFIDRARYDALPPAWRSLLATASRAVTTEMLSACDAGNPPALKRLVAAGAQLRPYPQAVLEACFSAAGDVYAEIVAETPAFEPIHRSLMSFRNEAFLHQQVAEYTYDTFMMIQQREGALAVAAP